MVRFTHPEMFWILIPFGIFLIWNYFQGKRTNKQIQSIGNKKIVNFLFNRAVFGRINLKYWLTILAVIFLILSAVGPQVGTKLTELKRKGVDVIIALDTSNSMNATDIKPSRIEKAKLELSRLINNLQGDRVGIIVFAGTSHLHCPLTSDYSAARLFLNMIDTDIVSAQGTDVSSAIELALKNIESEEEKFKVIILITDGEDHEGRAIELAKEAKKKNIVIHSVGVGTPSGGPIPILDDKGNRI
ncbi:MAG: VWA domain-containing protein, partial [Candidatus Marinimicrobia bacterium]|nr:VWA domain-containing protein [Candidatus Neomarinimicrobiota bacterium]